MIINDNRFKEKPHGNAIIWRYMSLEKFLDLLINSQLFFSNLNRLTDKYEGTVYDKNFKSEVKAIMESEFNGFDEIDLNHERARVEILKNFTLVNCWTMRRHESYALWKIYGGNNSSIAIKSTVSSLKDSINSTEQEFNEDIFMSKVKYQQKLDDSFSRIDATITKKPFYDFESEIRLIILNYNKSEGGYKIPYDISKGRTVKLNLEKLINEIYISPFLKKQYHQNLKHIIQKINPNLTKKFMESEILDN